MSGKHGAEHGEGVEKEAQSALNQQPLGQWPEGQTPQGRLRSGSQNKDGQLGQQQEGQPRQILGEEQGLPTERQGVHHTG